MFEPGDRVIYLAHKYSDHPGLGAENVEPEPHGEGYRYHVKKFWLVTAVQGDQVEVITRRGKRRRVHQSDPWLRSANWWERLFLRWRFPQAQDALTEATAKAG